MREEPLANSELRQTLGNFALSSAAAHDWPQAIAQLKEGLELCGQCSALPLLRKDLGLIYCRSGDLKNGYAELLEAQKLTPDDPDIAAALQVLQRTTSSFELSARHAAISLAGRRRSELK